MNQLSLNKANSCAVDRDIPLFANRPICTTQPLPVPCDASHAIGKLGGYNKPSSRKDSGRDKLKESVVVKFVNPCYDEDGQLLFKVRRKGYRLKDDAWEPV